MTQAQFIKVKLTAHKPQFKELVNLTKSESEASYLLDAMRFIHTGKYTCLSAQGSKGKVESDKGSFVYTLFTTHLLKKNIYSGIETLYKR